MGRSGSRYSAGAMKRSTRIKLGVFASGVLAVMLAIPATLISAYAITKAVMPYNDEGQYFDGLVVHHAGSEYVYGLLALGLWALAVLALAGAYRIHRRAPPT